MLYELILINEIEQRAKIIFLSVGWLSALGSQQAEHLRLVEQDWREHTAQTHNTQNHTTTRLSKPRNMS